MEFVQKLGEDFATAVSTTNDVLYTYILVALLILGGLYFTIRTKFAPFRLFGEQIRDKSTKRL
ncbi:MAG: sodium:alanine symporter family protein [Clostridia bacterium]|nr:sodium:alanine symporter family protein [Clostridia bacterium]